MRKRGVTVWRSSAAGLQTGASRRPAAGSAAPRGAAGGWLGERGPRDPSGRGAGSRGPRTRRAPRAVRRATRASAGSRRSILLEGPHPDRAGRRIVHPRYSPRHRGEHLPGDRATGLGELRDGDLLVSLPAEAADLILPAPPGPAGEPRQPPARRGRRAVLRG